MLRNFIGNTTWIPGAGLMLLGVELSDGRGKKTPKSHQMASA